MTQNFSLWMLAALAALISGRAEADPFEWAFEELAPGVWTGQREDAYRIPFMPNITFVVSGEGVVVFDGGGLPLMAERAIEKIRSLTDRPVTHVIVSHWHQDHNLGISAYRDRFPGVIVISHPYTREGILRNLAANEANARNFVPANFPALKTFVETGEYQPGAPLPEGESEWFAEALGDEAIIDSEYKRFVPTVPDATFEDALTIWSGGREIRVLHLGAGNTSGDIVMWLPTEKILAAGDLVVLPTPYGHGGLAGAWSETLKKIKALSPAALVPGHGPVQRDFAYVDLLIAALESVDTQVRALAAEGLGLADVQNQVTLTDFRDRFTGGDAFRNRRFAEWFAGPIVMAAYKLETGEDHEILPPLPESAEGD